MSFEERRSRHQAPEASLSPPAGARIGGCRVWGTEHPPTARASHHSSVAESAASLAFSGRYSVEEVAEYREITVSVLTLRRVELRRKKDADA